MYSWSKEIKKRKKKIKKGDISIDSEAQLTCPRISEPRTNGGRVCFHEFVGNEMEHAEQIQMQV